MTPLLTLPAIDISLIINIPFPQATLHRIRVPIMNNGDRNWMIVARLSCLELDWTWLKATVPIAWVVIRSLIMNYALCVTNDWNKCATYKQQVFLCQLFVFIVSHGYYCYSATSFLGMSNKTTTTTKSSCQYIANKWDDESHNSLVRESVHSHFWLLMTYDMYCLFADVCRCSHRCQKKHVLHLNIYPIRSNLCYNDNDCGQLYTMYVCGSYIWISQLYYLLFKMSLQVASFIVHFVIWYLLFKTDAVQQI